ncbi:MAG: hypothetical protein Q7T20_03005 [Saprospiraceae bacterium]|nr:hypothetical protein [Saprospiraceae bacterium]
MIRSASGSSGRTAADRHQCDPEKTPTIPKNSGCAQAMSSAESPPWEKPAGRILWSQRSSKLFAQERQ